MGENIGVINNIHSFVTILKFIYFRFTKQMKYSEYFDKRTNTFEKSYELILERMKTKNGISDDTTYNIVELGTTRSFVSGNHPDCMQTDTKCWRPDEPGCWDWGAGIFTKVFSDNLDGRNYKLYTIDPNENAIQIVTTMCGANKNVQIVQGYSSEFLKKIDFTIDLLYMDHMESGEEACIQHLKDSEYIIKNGLMSENSIILIDDIGDNITNTKGKYSIPYLLDNGYNQVLAEYQVLLEKDR
jgi:hypothetical protein